MNNFFSIIVAGALIAAAVAWSGYENGQAIRCANVLSTDGIAVVVATMAQNASDDVAVQTITKAVGCNALHGLWPQS